MVRLDLVRDKVRRLRETCSALRGATPSDAADLVGDRDRRDLVSFRVYLAMQEAIDLASHLVADQGWGPAPNLRDHFNLLERNKVIPQPLAADLSAGVKIRDLIGHAYADVDPGKLHAAAGRIPALMEAYCAAVISWADTPSASGTS